MSPIDLSADLHAWVKAIHIMGVIAWMAGLLYLPRLFVYHTECDVGSQQSETFKVMERRLLRVIMNPAMGVSLASGAVLLLNLDHAVWTEVWMYVKLACIAGLACSHMMMAVWCRAFAENRNRLSRSFYRIMNEVPAGLMVVIVIVVVVRPF